MKRTRIRIKRGRIWPILKHFYVRLSQVSSYDNYIYYYEGIETRFGNGGVASIKLIRRATVRCIMITTTNNNNIKGATSIATTTTTTKSRLLQPHRINYINTIYIAIFYTYLTTHSIYLTNVHGVSYKKQNLIAKVELYQWIKLVRCN